MQYVRLGRTGLKVSKLCVGTNMFGAGYVDDSQALAVIDAAYEQGVNFIDTADMYNGGLSEHVVGKAVKTKRNDFIVATKCFWNHSLPLEIIKFINDKEGFSRYLNFQKCERIKSITSCQNTKYNDY